LLAGLFLPAAENAKMATGGFDSVGLSRASFPRRISMRFSHAAACTVAVAAALMLATTASAPAQDVETPMVTAETATLIATLSGANVVPPVTTPATGMAYILYDPNTMTLSWTVAYDGLSGPVTMAHFHGPATATQNAGIAVSLGLFEGFDPQPEDLTSPINGSTTLTSDQASQLLAGQWYVNIHTTANSGGEIRGQVLPKQ
jgi:hypothetical protein